jgi:hypothetical protein
MRKVWAAALLALAAALGAAQQEPQEGQQAKQPQRAKLPVFYLRYTGGVGMEEPEYEDAAALEPSSVRNSVSLRIKEELSRAVVGNLTLYYSTKDYKDGTADYSYFYLKPEMSLDLTDRVTLETQLRSKWVSYDEAASAAASSDYLELSGGVATTYAPVRGTRITGLLKSGFELYENDARSQQTWAAGLRVLSRLDGVTVGASYRGTLYTPLGAASEESTSLTNEFGVSLTWDPNR